MITIPMTTMPNVTLNATVSVSGVTFPATVGSDTAALSASIGASYSMGEYSHYDGSYTFTPGAEAQVISTEDLVMDNDITIEAIPSNYGLITWNGSYLTVS